MFIIRYTFILLIQIQIKDYLYDEIIGNRKQKNREKQRTLNR